MMMRAARSLLAVSAALFLALAPAAQAATLETEITPEMAEMGCTARLSGPIVDGDLEQLRPFLETPLSGNLFSEEFVQDLVYRNFAPVLANPDYGFFTHRLCLDSPGGSLEEAVRIVEYLREEHSQSTGGIPTAIARGDRCDSACAYIFLAGRFILFSGADHYEGRANAILHPEGRLGLHAPFLPFEGGTYSADELRQIWQIGMDATSLISRQIANGNVFMPVELFFEMMTYPPDEMLVIDTVGHAVSWDLQIEPTLLNAMEFTPTQTELHDAICRNAMPLTPDYVDLELLSESLSFASEDAETLATEPVFRDRLSERTYRCVSPIRNWEEFQQIMFYRREYGGPLLEPANAPYNRPFRVSFAADEDCFSCDLEIDLMELAAFPPDTRLSEIAVPMK